MRDGRLVMYSSFANVVYNNTGTGTTWTNNGNTPSGKSAITGTVNTGWLSVADLLGNSQVSPFRGLTLAILMSTITTANSPSAVAFPFTVTYSDDGSNAAANSSTETFTATSAVTSNVGANVNGYFRLPAVLKHSYIKLTLSAPTFTGGSSPTVSAAVFDWHLDQFPDSRVATELS